MAERVFHGQTGAGFGTLGKLACRAVMMLAAVPAAADTIYWNGTGTTWSPAGNWSTDPNATTPAPAAVPGASDDLVFNITTLMDPQVIGLSSANQAARSLAFNSTGAVNN